jgi:hypothetical protein
LTEAALGATVTRMEGVDFVRTHRAVGPAARGEDLVAAVALATALLLLGCKSVEERHPHVPLVAATERTTAQLDADSRISVPETLTRGGWPAGSRWEHVGDIPTGAVYRPLGDVLMLRSSETHEAFAVIRDGRCVGVYLPVPQVFVPSAEGTPFSLVAPKGDVP